MHTTTLGTTGLVVSAIGLGCMGMSGLYGPAAEDECIANTRDKVRLLSLGNPICCPSVMINRSLLADFRFPGGFQTNLDWMAWLELARRPGGFVYVRECLVSKGVHAGSETSATIANRAREREDGAIFKTLWPPPVAAALATVYRLGYRANRF